MKNHLAVYSNTKFESRFADLILDGNKTVDIKMYRNKIAPYEKMNAGDLVYIKLTGGGIVGRFGIEKVEYYDTTQNPKIIQKLLTQNMKEIGISGIDHVMRIVSVKKSARYVTIFWIKSPKRCEYAMPIRKNDRRVWISDCRFSSEILEAFE